MKKTMLAVLVVLCLSCFGCMSCVGCVPKVNGKDYIVIDPYKAERAPEDQELNREEWETLFPGTTAQSGLWRYIDKDTGNVVYMNSHGYITAVKNGEKDE